jgi:hypothetical protein
MYSSVEKIDWRQTKQLQNTVTLKSGSLNRLQFKRKMAQKEVNINDNNEEGEIRVYKQVRNK